MATSVTLPLLETVWRQMSLSPKLWNHEDLFLFFGTSICRQAKWRSQKWSCKAGKLLFAKKMPSFVSETSILLTMELKIPEFGMKFWDWGSEYRLSIKQTGKRRQDWPKRLSNLSMVTKPLELKNQTWAPLCQAVTGEVSCGAQHRGEVHPLPTLPRRTSLRPLPFFHGYHRLSHTHLCTTHPLPTPAMSLPLQAEGNSLLTQNSPSQVT